MLEVGREGEREGRSQRRKKRKSAENINVRAAFIHVIGDLIQSIGVVIAGYVIWFKVCTLGVGGELIPGLHRENGA